MIKLSSSYLLGLFFILCVTIIWSIASIIVQYLYNNLEFHSPFLLSYISTSLFAILLPTRLIWEFYWKCCCSCWLNPNENYFIPYKSGPLPEDDGDNDVEDKVCSETNENELNPLNKKIDKEMNNFEIDQDEENYDAIMTSVKDSSANDGTTLTSAKFILGHYETFWLSMQIAPIWFLADYSYNLSLAYTTITSSTILANTSTLFTFLFALSLKQESFSKYKIIGVILCMSGSLMTGLADAEEDDTAHNSNSPVSGEGTWLKMLGDASGLISAIGYGAYTVLIRKICPKDESKISMQLMFGYIGILNFLILSPVCIYIIFNHSIQISQQTLFWLILKGLLDNVLSDYLWARSVVLTTALVATVGLGLTIPLAFLSDFFIHKIDPQLETIFGAAAVLIGFILVNVDQIGSTST